MKFLTWYSMVIVGMSIAGLLIDTLTVPGVDAATNLWGIILYVPILVFLILIPCKKII